MSGICLVRTDETRKVGKLTINYNRRTPASLRIPPEQTGHDEAARIMGGRTPVLARSLLHLLSGKENDLVRIISPRAKTRNGIPARFSEPIRRKSF